MNSLSVVGLAILASTMSGRAMIVIEALSEGGSHRLGAAFPSLDEKALNTLTDDGFVILPFDSTRETHDQFDYILHNLESESTLVTATVTQIGLDGEKRRFTGGGGRYAGIAA